MVWLDNARILACIGIVFLHVATGIRMEHTLGTGPWWLGNIYEAAVRWGVPVFVMASGALLLDPGRYDSLSTFYRKRLSRILLPLLFWTVFYLAWAYAKSVLKGNPLPAGELARRLLSGRPHYHLWFLYMIPGLYLFAPFLRKGVAHSTAQELKWIVGVMFFLAAVHAAWRGLYMRGEPSLFLVWFLAYVPFFVTGYIIRCSEDKPRISLLGTVLVASFFATALGCYFVGVHDAVERRLYFNQPLSVTIIPMSVSAMLLLKRLTSPLINIKFTRRLASMTLGIYLIHPFLLEIVNYKGLWTNSFNPVLSAPALATCVFILSGISVWAISQIPYLRRTI